MPVAMKAMTDQSVESGDSRSSSSELNDNMQPCSGSNESQHSSDDEAPEDVSFATARKAVETAKTAAADAIKKLKKKKREERQEQDKKNVEQQAAKKRRLEKLPLHVVKDLDDVPADVAPTDSAEEEEDKGAQEEADIEDEKREKKKKKKKKKKTGNIKFIVQTPDDCTTTTTERATQLAAMREAMLNRGVHKESVQTRRNKLLKQRIAGKDVKA